MFNPSGGKHVTAAAEGGGKSATRTGRTVQLALAHLIDVSALERAYGRSRKAAAVGVDGVTKEEYDRDAVKEAAQYGRDRELEQWDRDLLEEREAMAERLEGRSLGQCCRGRYSVIFRLLLVVQKVRVLRPGNASAASVEELTYQLCKNIQLEWLLQQL